MEIEKGSLIPDITPLAGGIFYIRWDIVSEDHHI